MSLQLVEALQVPRDTAVLDVGGGASTLTAGLTGRGFTDLTVLDVSARALELLTAQLTSAADRVHVHTVCRDLLEWQPLRRYGLWHDRALLHFLTRPEERERYVDIMRSALADRAWVIIGVFAPDGPEHCSGLQVMRYSAEQLAELLGEGFRLWGQRREAHVTPGGVVQPFQWAAFQRA